MKNETVLENLNVALTKLTLEDEKIVLIGEDIVDPYGGAFKVTKGISSLVPDRVISTPISEESFTNMGIGMAIKGYKPIIDLMFSDFMTLIFDPVVNFASKYITMYGRRCDLSMIVRCANGGYRGYGPTHSQSMQKYFMGIPNLSVYEMTPFHNNLEVFQRMLQEGNICIYFEEKLLYGNKLYQDNKLDDIYSYSLIGEHDNWAAVSTENESNDVVIITHGGIVNKCIQAARKLLMEEEIESKILVPSKLFPCDIEGIMDEIQSAGKVLIVEECTAGATWGNEILSNIYASLEDKNTVLIKTVSSKASIVPASFSHEKEVLISEDDIVEAILSMQ